MMKPIRIVAGVCALVLLTACGESAIGARVAGLVTGQAPAAQAAPALVPAEVMHANPGKYIRINIRKQNAWASLTQAGTNGARTTWIDQGNISVTFENGLVVATRGLVRDLMGTDLSQSWAAIRNQGGEAQRRHDFLTDQDEISTELLQCSIVSEGNEVIERAGKSISTRRFTEKCEGERLIFTNIYWVNQRGAMVRSLQAVSPDAGYLQIDVF
ncbi:YjbF family lipoprotein [Loktanella sp. S4079]|uniref:YjbF family lipoprotein n=1 Tax=Loktanella sp. S4079 TaxID=579483 RepID=UPI00138DF6B8|nr:YjbF family lipoprotein [Loktanella sp. S4079]